MAWSHASNANASARRFVAPGARRLSSQDERRPHACFWNQLENISHASLKAEEILTGALGKVLELLKLERVNSARIAVREEGFFILFFNRVGTCSVCVITLVIGIKAGSRHIKAAFYN